MNKNSSPSPLKVFKGTAWFFIILGSLFLTIGAFLLMSATNSHNWQRVSGKVENTSIGYRVDRQGPTGDLFYRYYYEVNYTYTVDGQVYHNNNFSLGSGDRASVLYKERTEASKHARRNYPAGSVIAVFYDPGNPETSLLKTGADWGTYVPMMIGLVSLALGIPLLRWVRAREASSSIAHSSQAIME